LAKLISDIIGIIRISGTIGIIGIYLIFSFSNFLISLPPHTQL